MEVRSAANSNFKLLTNLRKRAIRIVADKSFQEHTNPLFTKLKLLKILQTYKLELSKLMYKVHSNSLQLLLLLAPLLFLYPLYIIIKLDMAMTTIMEN